VVEQPIRNRQVASSTLALGSNSKKTNEFLKPVTTAELTWRQVPSKFHRSFRGHSWRSGCLWLRRVAYEDRTGLHAIVKD
jgi:hypothetical protein